MKKNWRPKEERFKRFRKEFPNMPKEEVKHVFNWLWTSDMLSYPELIDVAILLSPYASTNKQHDDN